MPELPMICGCCEQPIDSDREEWGTLHITEAVGTEGRPFMHVHESCWNESE
jgi:hypothetical protein